MLLNQEEREVTEGQPEEGDAQQAVEPREERILPGHPPRALAHLLGVRVRVRVRIRVRVRDMITGYGW